MEGTGYGRSQMLKEMYQTYRVSLYEMPPIIEIPLISCCLPRLTNPKLLYAQPQIPLGVRQATPTVLSTCLPLCSQAKPGEN